MTEQKPEPSHAVTLTSSALMMDINAIERIERVADLMATARATVPKHFHGNKGDCFAVALQATTWGMNPFAVAQKTHLINFTMGYEAQLVASVINSSRLLQDRFHFEWFGPWEKIIGKFKSVESKTKKDDNGHPKVYIVPDWRTEDEYGLGVKVWATIKGETSPRELTLLMTQARTRNSTLWTEDPKQQLAYLAQKRWARLYAPDVILGVYTADELAEPQVYAGAVIDAETGEITQPKQQSDRPAPQVWPEEAFSKQFERWRMAVANGIKSTDDILAMARSKGALTHEQEQRIRELKPAAQPNVVDAEPKESPQTPPGMEQHADFLAGLNGD